MANICSNDYHFIFSDAEKAKKFLDFVESSDCESSVYEMGIKANIKDAENRDVREWVQSAYVVSPTTPNKIGVMTDSKWTPCPNAWEDIAKTFDENVIVYYEAEEPGCEIYASNDPEFIGKYIYDFWNASKELEACGYDETGIVDEEQLVKILQAVLHTKTKCLETLMILMGDKGFADDFSLHQIEYCSIEDWAE